MTCCDCCPPLLDDVVANIACICLLYIALSSSFISHPGHNDKHSIVQ